MGGNHSENIKMMYILKHERNRKKFHQISLFISKFTQTATWNLYIEYTNLYIISNPVLAGSFHFGVKNRFYLQAILRNVYPFISFVHFY